MNPNIPSPFHPKWDTRELTQEEWVVIAKAVLAYPKYRRLRIPAGLRRICQDYLLAKGYKHAL